MIKVSARPAYQGGIVSYGKKNRKNDKQMSTFSLVLNPIPLFMVIGQVECLCPQYFVFPRASCILVQANIV